MINSIKVFMNNIIIATTYILTFKWHLSTSYKMIWYQHFKFTSHYFVIFANNGDQIVIVYSNPCSAIYVHNLSCSFHIGMWSISYFIPQFTWTMWINVSKMVLVKSNFSTTPPKANLDANKLKVTFELRSMCPFFLVLSIIS